MMKHCIAVAVLMFLFAPLVICQTKANRGLVLTGSVVSVKPNFVSKSNDKEVYDFDVELYLQFRNDTDKPVIIFKPGDFYGQKKIAFLEQVASKLNSEESSTVIAWKNPYGHFNYDPFPSFLRELTAPEPAKYRFAIIAAEGYYECHETIRVETGYKLQKVPGPKPYDSPRLFAIPEFPALRLEFYLSLKDRHEDADALGTAQRRWKKSGELALDSSGDYRVKSEVILNKLPD